MLFNSYEFIFLLLPISVIGDRFLRQNYRGQIYWLLLCSAFFYGWWNVRYLPLLAGSIGFNFWVGRSLRANPSRAKLIVGIVANLGLIANYKYGKFLSDSLEVVVDHPFSVAEVALPLAISFFTFQQIAYLVDCYRGDSESYGLAEYSLFVSFFPQLIAGPIIHHGEMMPQMRDASRGSRHDLAVGMAIFFVGLFKKTVLADRLAPFANDLFDNPESWQSVTFIPAWIGIFAYSFQIYFDFSGYSDMALGAARMFGIKLPLNFFSPYRALTISEFWRRWHITLSRFLRDYIYIPLGGNRYGEFKRYRNLLLTMLLGGLWHGAGWTFMGWGFLHGVYLVIQQIWSRHTESITCHKERYAYRIMAWAITFLSVNVAWVFFRASSFDSAMRILAGAVGLEGISIPSGLANQFGAAWLSQVGVVLDDRSGASLVTAITWIAIASFVTWMLPTTFQWMQHEQPAIDAIRADSIQKLSQRPKFGFTPNIVWRPSLAWALITAAISVTGILSLSEVSEFLYFQF